MVAPGSLEARYGRLAGSEDRRRELYVVRRHLGYTIDEWTALPWWQRRLYLEQMQEEADEAADRAGGTPGGGPDPYDAILNGTLGDVHRATGATTT